MSRNYRGLILLNYRVYTFTNKLIPLHVLWSCFQFNSQNSPVSPQVGMGAGVQAPGINAVTSASLHQQSMNANQQQSTQHTAMPSSHKDAGICSLP